VCYNINLYYYFHKNEGTFKADSIIPLREREKGIKSGENIVELMHLRSEIKYLRPRQNNYDLDRRVFSAYDFQFNCVSPI